MSKKETGIFCGLEDIANHYLLDRTWTRKDGGQPSFGHKTNWLRLSVNAAPGFFTNEAAAMIRDMVKQIETNVKLLEKGRKRSPSAANWDFAYRKHCDPNAGAKSTRPEVTLERAIILARRKRVQASKDEWTYQMPVATGLFGSDIDKSANIDLVRKHPNGEFDLIELKLGSNNPLYAAIEILQYGLVYAVSRRLAEANEYDSDKLEILKAKQIRLCVLAPKSFYEPAESDKYNFDWLVEALNEGLKYFKEEGGYEMTFQLCLLDLNWKPTGCPNEQVLDQINDAIDNIRPVSWAKTTQK